MLGRVMLVIPQSKVQATRDAARTGDLFTA
jgi:hypothetical protein